MRNYNQERSISKCTDRRNVFAQNRVGMSSAKCFFTFGITVEKGHKCHPHDHPCTEIVFNRGCSGLICCDGVSAKYSDGTFFTHQPGRDHWIRNDRQGSQFCIGISGCNSDRIPFGVFKTTEGTENIISRIMSEAESDNPFKGDYIDMLAGQLSIEILRISQKPEGSGGLPYHADAAKKIIDSRFDERISIGEIASSLFISPDYLRQLFRETFGESPMHYLIRRRIEFACHQLSDGQSSLSDIAAKCGIGNPYYFSRIFRKVTGVPPSVYRERNCRPRPVGRREIGNCQGGSVRCNREP